MESSMETDSLTPSPGSDPPDYGDVISFEESPIYQAVANVDAKETHHLLNLGYAVYETGKFGQSLLHGLVYTLYSRSSEFNHNLPPERLKIVYMLSNAGINFDAKDHYEQTALQYAVHNGDYEMCDTLLQCGADMFVLEENGFPLYNNIMDENANKIPYQTTVSNVFKKYEPGLWDAVASENLTAVRKLINIWCKTDLNRNNKTLQELAQNTGNEGIISLTNAIIPSMRLVHHVLANDLKGMSELLNSNLRPKIHMNLKNMGHYNAPIIYFVIQSKEVEMLKEFKKQGCNVVTHMLDEDENEMPVLFSALTAEMPATIITELLPESNVDGLHLMENLHYKGKNILQAAIEKNVAVEAVDAILTRGGPVLVCQRNVHNQTARDWAMINQKTQYVELIDMHVVKWVIDQQQHYGWRETLALWGYENVARITQRWMQENSICIQAIAEQVFEYLETVDQYQDQISELAAAIETGDYETFCRKIVYEGPGSFYQDLWWDGRPKGEGLPLLHRAVLFNQFDIVALILTMWESRGSNDPVDRLRDQAKRTALHYACGIPQASKIVNLLYQYGCSEHMLDKDGREPLDFAEVRDTHEMSSLLDRMRYKQYNLPEPNPWDPDLLLAVRYQRAQSNFTSVTHHACGHSHLPSSSQFSSFHSPPFSPSKSKETNNVLPKSFSLSYAMSSTANVTPTRHERTLSSDSPQRYKTKTTEFWSPKKVAKRHREAKRDKEVDREANRPLLQLDQFVEELGTDDQQSVNEFPSQFNISDELNNSSNLSTDKDSGKNCTLL